MSQIKFQNKLLKFLENIDKVPDRFFRARYDKYDNAPKDVIWLISREDGTADSYETSQERFGITKDGKIIWGFSSGCSCWDGWNESDIHEPVTWKEFIMIEDIKDPIDSDIKRDKWGFVESWQDAVEKNIDDFLLLFKQYPSLKEILEVENAELRSYLIKLYDYEKIRLHDKTKLMHRDGDYELILVNDINMYVKCKDSSTDRVFLLNVPLFVKTCKQAIAWTFSLNEHEYNPIIET